MSTEVTIRPARHEDRVQLARLIAEVDALHHAGAPWLFKTPEGTARAEGYLDMFIGREDAAAFVADLDGVVGAVFGMLRTAPDIFRPPHWAVLDGLVVAHTSRRNGIGRRLTHAFEAWAAERGAPFVELNVYDFNEAARSFYASLGYLPLSTKLRKPVE